MFESPSKGVTYCRRFCHVQTEPGLYCKLDYQNSELPSWNTTNNVLEDALGLSVRNICTSHGCVGVLTTALATQTQVMRF